MWHEETGSGTYTNRNLILYMDQISMSALYGTCRFYISIFICGTREQSTAFSGSLERDLHQVIDNGPLSISLKLILISVRQPSSFIYSHPSSYRYYVFGCYIVAYHVDVLARSDSTP